MKVKILMEKATNATPTGVSGNGHVYHCGTLTYTKFGIAMLFGWLLWGDFCYTLMEAVVPSILPLKLKDLGCSNWLMGAILTTAPGILGMTICPWVSFKSDRYRSRWGRRVPFIVWTMPFLCACLALLGWSEDITGWLRQNATFLRDFTPSTITIAVIAVFMIMFQFFYMFVGSVFWYLFNDVVPQQFMGRFIGAIRIIGTGAGALYNYFVFKYAESHMREIFLGAAVLYLVGFGLMCLMVKEGEYPPTEGEDDASQRGMGGIRTFFKECFTHKFYWLVFAVTAVCSITWPMWSFQVFFQKEMGLTLDHIGKLAAVSGVTVMVAIFFVSVFVDRWHPLRIFVYSIVFNTVGTLLSWIWIFVTLPGDYFFWLSMGTNLIVAFQSAIMTVASLPLYMRLFPKSRFGQFCSAQALLRSLATVGAGIGAGLFIDGVKWLCHGSDFAYRFNFVWMFIFTALAAVIILYAYLYWYKLGGDANYHPPAPWSDKGVEEIAIVTTISPQTKWLNLAFCLFEATMAVSALGLIPLMWWMYRKQTTMAFHWFGILVLPLSFAAWVGWKWLERNIRKDMERARNGEELHNGIPHHGMLVIVAVKFLLTVGLWIAQVIIAINLKMESEAVLFGIANVMTNFLLIGAVWLLARVERGHSTRIDTFLAVSADDMEAKADESNVKSPAIA